MNSSLIGKTVLVTGAAGGIGNVLVEFLSNNGFKVIGSDYPNAQPYSAYEHHCQGWIPADLERLSQDQGELDAFSAAVLEATPNGDLFGIVHNAAVQVVRSFDQLTPADWQKSLAVNVLAPAMISRKLLPVLQSNSGSIVHIGSIHSTLTKKGFAAYATSKAALSGLTRSMAVELGDSVRVNAIAPAAISTPMLEAGFGDNPNLQAQLEAFHPTGSIGRPDDVARAVLFLLDPSNAFLNGCILPLGGGIHNRLHDPA